MKLILEIQRQVTVALLPESEAGKLRKKHVVVNDPKTGRVVYLPPDIKDLESLVEDLTAYITREKAGVDPLILAGIFHKQMVIIHPFVDGNGRTTRLATKALLAEMGLDTFHLFSFENYYNQNITKYFQTVGEFGNYYDLVSEIDFTNWLEYFTEGIIDELLRVEKLLPGVILTPETQLEDYHFQLLNHIREKGYIKDSGYAKFAGRAKATRTQDFNKLIKNGLIERKGKGKATYYILKQR